jgi:hypothetical protein
MADARTDRLRLVDPATGRLAVAELLPKIVAQLRQLSDVAAVLAMRKGARFAVLGARCGEWLRRGCPPDAGGTEAR